MTTEDWLIVSLVVNALLVFGLMAVWHSRAMLIRILECIERECSRYAGVKAPEGRPPFSETKGG